MILNLPQLDSIFQFLSLLPVSHDVDLVSKYSLHLSSSSHTFNIEQHPIAFFTNHLRNLKLSIAQLRNILGWVSLVLQDTPHHHLKVLRSQNFLSSVKQVGCGSLKALTLASLTSTFGGVGQMMGVLLLRLIPALLPSLTTKTKSADVPPGVSVCAVADSAKRIREERKCFTSRKMARKQGTNNSDPYSWQTESPAGTRYC